MEQAYCLWVVETGHARLRQIKFAKTKPTNTKQ